MKAAVYGRRVAHPFQVAGITEKVRMLRVPHPSLGGVMPSEGWEEISLSSAEADSILFGRGFPALTCRATFWRPAARDSGLTAFSKRL
jgi:hypothetical protein